MLGRRALLAEQLELFYRAHRSELEKGKKKSIELRFGKVGIKVSAPSLNLLRGWTWDKVLTALTLAGLKSCIRTEESVDKTAIKAAMLSDEKLAEIGVKFHQEEKFWFETKPVSLKREDM